MFCQDSVGQGGAGAWEQIYLDGGESSHDMEFHELSAQGKQGTMWLDFFLSKTLGLETSNLQKGMF